MHLVDDTEITVVMGPCHDIIDGDTAHQLDGKSHGLCDDTGRYVTYFFFFLKIIQKLFINIKRILECVLRVPSESSKDLQCHGTNVILVTISFQIKNPEESQIELRTTSF